MVVGRPSSRVNEDYGAGYPSVRLPGLTMSGDSDPCNLAEEGKKGGNLGDRGHNYEERRKGKHSPREGKWIYFASEVERKDEKKSCFGCKKPGAGFLYKLINEVDE
jgi:hypothetical protein